MLRWIRLPCSRASTKPARRTQLRTSRSLELSFVRFDRRKAGLPNALPEVRWPGHPQLSYLQIAAGQQDLRHLCDNGIEIRITSRCTRALDKSLNEVPRRASRLPRCKQELCELVACKECPKSTRSECSSFGALDEEVDSFQKLLSFFVREHKLRGIRALQRSCLHGLRRLCTAG